MNIEALKQILQAVAAGSQSVDDAAESLKHLSFQDIEYAHIDHHRSLRKGFPEVIFGQGKTADQITGILLQMSSQEDIVLVTRVDNSKAKEILPNIPTAEYHDDAKMLIHSKRDVSITGKGNASKEQVAAMLINLLSLTDPPDYLDATDGLAVAVCHYFQKIPGTGAKKYSSWKGFVGDNPGRIS